MIRHITVQGLALDADRVNRREIAQAIESPEGIRDGLSDAARVFQAEKEAAVGIDRIRPQNVEAGIGLGLGW